MTATEKAKELVRKYWDLGGIDVLEAKQCALIAVEEILNTEFEMVDKLLECIKKNKINIVISLNKEYWQEVKEELLKL